MAKSSNHKLKILYINKILMWKENIMGMLHEICVESFGIGGRQMLKRLVGLNPKPQGYRDYKSIVTDYSREINKNSCTKINIIKTYLIQFDFIIHLCTYDIIH